MRSLPAAAPAAIAIAFLATTLPGSAEAAVKLYSSDRENGLPSDERRFSLNVCPPLTVTPEKFEGYIRLVDDGLGTVTLSEFVTTNDSQTILGEDILVTAFGPGAFLFITTAATRTVTVPQTSTTTGIGAHGPSGTATGESAEWGVLSGFEVSGFEFCISSPVTICDQNVSPHGMTAITTINSPTYDLGTWNFDAEGDLEAASWFITSTNNGGLSNNQQFIRGAFVGASLPALPLVGLGALAAAVGVMGGRALHGRR